MATRGSGRRCVAAAVAGAVVLSLGAVPRHAGAEPPASLAVAAHAVALPTGDRLTVSTDAAGRTVASPRGAGSGPYVTEQLGGHRYVFPAAAAADRGARSGGRARYDVAPAVTDRGSASPRYPMRTVTLDVLDASGQPAASGWADLVDTDDSDRYAAETRISGGQARVSVPDGHYGGLVSQETWNGSDLVAAWLVFVEFTVDGGATSVTVDARTARRVSVGTPRPADLQAQDLVWYRGSGEQGGMSDGYVGAPASTAFYVGADPGGPGALHFYLHDRLDSPATSTDRYLYDAEFPADDAILPGHRYRVDPSRLATVRVRYFSPTGTGTGRQAWFSLLPWETFELRGSYPVTEPSERTEYLATAPDLTYHAWVATAGDSTAAVMDSGTYAYRPGQFASLDWNAGPLAPGLPADTGLDTYRASYDLSVADPALPHPFSSRTTWTFRSAHSGTTTVPARWACGQTGTTDGCSPLSLLTAGYQLPETLDGHLPTGPQPLRISLRHNAGVPALPVRQVGLAVSDGGGWTALPVVSLGGGLFQTVLDLPAGAAGHVLSLRLSAVDEAGGRFDQQIDDAALIEAA